MTRQITSIFIAALVSLFLLAPQAAAQNATGAPSIAPRDDSDNTASLTTVVPGTNYASGMTTGGGNIRDADGITANADSWTRSWQTSADGGSSWTSEVGTARRYGPKAADETAGHLRVCVFFTDSAGNAEGGSPSSTAAERLSNATLCSAAAVVSSASPPTGAITIQAKGDSTATTSLTVVTIGAEYDVGETTGGGNIADPNGNPTSLRKSWQRSSDGTTWTEAATFVTGTDGENSYTVVEADRTAGHLRACVFFTDGGGFAEGGTATDAGTRASTATICAPTISTFNDTAVAGAITAADGTDLSTTGPNEGDRLTAAEPTDPQGTTTATFSWQWAQNDFIDSPTLDVITTATSNTFTPSQDLVGRYLHVCASFTDDAGNAERACTALRHQVRNVNQAPTGRIAINTYANRASNTGLTTLVQGTAYSMGYITGGGNIMDTDGDATQPATTGRGVFGDPGEGISWQSAPASSGPWTEVIFGGDRDDPVAEFAPQQAHVGGYMRVCVFSLDGQGTLEGGDSESPTTRAAATSENTCSIAASVTNANDAPTASDGSISLEATETHTFTATDFPFRDEDNPMDRLASVIIETLPTAGTLANGGTTLSGRTTIDVADIGNLVYTPSASASAGDTDRFTFNVIDDGSDGSDNKTSTNAATITITIIVGAQTAASGAPTAAATDSTATDHNEDVELTASTSGITEPNGIDTGSLQWQWYSAAAPATGMPADDDYEPIDGANAATFTPLQAHVGMYIRVCARFNDGLGKAEGGTAAAPTLCSAGTIIANVNDAPTSADNAISIFTTATSYTFKEADFAFADEDSAHTALASITITGTTIPSGATFTNDGTAVADDTTVMRADIGDLVFTPASGAAVMDNYASFSFTVSDGSASSTPANTITINIVAPGPVAATGMPAITGTPTQGQTLSAGRGTVADANGINESSIMWQWEQAAAADGTYAPIDSDMDDPDALTLAQSHVGQFVRVCISFMDNNDPATAEGPLCSDATTAIVDINDAPTARDHTYLAARTAGNDTVTIPASAFQGAYSDPDDNDMLESVTITALPDEEDGILNFGGTPVMTGMTLSIADNGEFAGGPLTFAIAASAGNLQETSFMFTLSDGDADSAMAATLSIRFGKDIEENEVMQVSAILAASAVGNATGAIGSAISAGPTASTFELSLGGTSLTGLSRTLHRDATTTADSTDMPQGLATAEQRAWYLGTADSWEYDAAYNATDDSAESLVRRLQSMANGDIAMNWQAGGSATRFWARYQSIDISGNEGEALEYDGSGSGFYIGADRRINDKTRIGLAISSDSADISLDLDDDTRNDEATRSATTIYPYLHIALGDSSEARIIAGIGSGDLEIKSTANSDNTATADLSWNMLAASITRHKDLRGRLSARFDGSFQLGNSSVDATTFTNGSNLMAADSSTNEIAVNAELKYNSGGFSPFASLTGRKLGGDLSQSLAMDLGLGADIATDPAIIRLAITRQINDTTHQRDSLSLDIATNPNPGGLSASLGSRYDSLSGRPQWQSTVRWQRRTAELSLAASQSDYRLQARLRW